MDKIPTTKYTAVGAGAVLAALASGVAATHVFNGTESTTTLDRLSAVRTVANAVPALDGTGTTADGGRTISIPVHVTAVAGNSVTWSFDR